MVRRDNCGNFQKNISYIYIYIYMGIPPDGPYWSILGGRPRRADLHLGPDNCGIVQGKRDRYYCGIVRGKKEPDCKF